MDLALANRLVGPQGRPALLAAAAEADPDSVGAATRLRAHFDNELSAAALTQVTLRRRAVTKFGPPAAMLFFTTEALQQASRPRVSQWRADRMAAAVGAGGTVLDLGCGIGADALALARAGLAVVAVERDPATAVFAAANLATADLATADGTAVVRVGDAQTLGPTLLDADRSAGVFCDPARRDDRGRVWRVDQFSPGWDFVTSLV
ncbi:MAG: methyltransferase domain-containing protein, partial [Propionibacteriaceae bacterium]